ncbi:MAG TPA: PAS domain S-box protein [Gaiellaceae bacterium]|nr:PAS domain S-box protein [Gaiellaceae bacterium]
MVEFRHSSIFSRLRGLLDVTRLVRSESDLRTVLDEIAHTISDSLGFRTVVVNLYRPAWDAFQVTSVHGNEDARAALLGETRDRAAWGRLLDEAYELRGAYLIPHDLIDWAKEEIVTWVPQIEASSAADAWHPEDALLVPMRHTDGHLLGVLSVDEPLSGRRPSPDELDVLVAAADHAALAVQSAQETAQASRHRAALEQLLELSTGLTGTRSVDEVLAEVCDGVRKALGFGKVAVELHDPATGVYAIRAQTGTEDVDLGPPLSAEALEALLDPGFELEGCFLLPDDEARSRLPEDRPGYRSRMNGSGPYAWNHHWLLVPLVDRDGGRIGFLWADDPDDRLLPGRERLQALRAFGNHASAALHSAAQFAALEDAKDRRQALIDASPLAIVDIDRDGRVRSWNPAAERMFGWTAAEAIGAEPLWLPEDAQDTFHEWLAEVLDGHSFSGREIERQRKDGSTVEVSLSVAPVAAASGEIVGVMAVLADVTERRRTERALVASEARTAAVLQAALDAVITIDHVGRIVEFNPAAEETFGWTSGEVLGRDFLTLALPPRLRGGFSQTIRTGAGSLLGSRLEIEALRSDGREFSAELVLSRVAVEGPPLFSACLRDITRRKAQEEQLRETVAKYRTLVERLPIASYVNELGLPVRTTWISPQIEPMLGYLPEEWLAAGFFEGRIHPDDRERVLESVRHTHETADAFRQEYRLIGKDGRVVWVLDETVAVRDEEYRPLFLQGFLIDVTDRKASEEALRQSEQLYRLVVENTTDAVTLLGPDGTVVYSSPSTQARTGWTSAELHGRPFTDFVHPDDVEATGARLRASLDTNEPMAATARIRHRDGAWVEYMGISLGITDPEGGPAGMLVIARPLVEPALGELRLVG